MLMQIMAGFACMLAALLQFAVYRSPDHPDSYFTRMGRRIGMVALLLGGVYAFYMCINRAESGPVFLILILFGMSQSLFALSDLLPHLEKERQSWTSRLNSSP